MNSLQRKEDLPLWYELSPYSMSSPWSLMGVGHCLGWEQYRTQTDGA